MASSKPSSPSTINLNINIKKENNLKERKEEEGGYGNEIGDDLDDGTSSNDDD